MINYRRPYLSYLVRLWGETTQEQVIWRASLESVQGGECSQFTSVAQLFEFVEMELQREAKVLVAIATANGQPGKIDELPILWRTSLARLHNHE